MSHTPGPWRVKTSDIPDWEKFPERAIILADNHGTIAEIHNLRERPNPNFGAAQRANATLIAAAPEMLEALKLYDSALRRIYGAAEALLRGAENPQECVQDIQKIVLWAMQPGNWEAPAFSEHKHLPHCAIIRKAEGA